MEPEQTADPTAVTIEISGLRVRGHHGVSDAEQEVGQWIEIDLALEVSDCAAASSDLLSDTLDYGLVCDAVAATVATERCRTLEALCCRVGGDILDRFGCAAVQVRVAKPDPPLPHPVDDVAVEAEFRR